MPYKNKRNKRFERNKKQENRIKKKLMDISCKVDYYIYKNKPISVADATSYYHEVTSYEALCKHDKRSLQVIEKLSRCMIAIIEEQTGQNISEANFNRTHSQSVNNNQPAYSQTQNDKLELSGSEYNREIVNVGKSILRVRQEDKPNTRTICEMNNIAENGLDEDITCIDLTLCEDEDTTVVESELCSQSILGNVVGTEMENLQSMYVDECGQGINEIDKAVHDLLKGHNPLLAQKNNVAVAENTCALQNQTIKTVKIQDVPNKLLDLNETKRTKENIKTNCTKPVRQRKTQDSVITGRKTNRNKKNTNRERKETNTDKETTNQNKNFISKNVASTEKQKLPSNNFNLICYESDLSWIENIKYVRQINNDEYDTTLAFLGESLWENCYLPTSWDDFA